MTQTPTLLVPRDVGSLRATAPCFRATQLCANEPWSCSLQGAPGSSAVPPPRNFCVLVQRGGGGWSSCGSQVGSRRRPRARGRGTDRGSTGCGTASPPRTSPLQPSLATTHPARCSPGKKEEQSAGPGSRWCCISPGLPLSPPLPSAEAPAVPACSLELKAKPAVESAALVHWGLIPAPGGQQPPPPPPELSESRAPTPAPGAGGLRAVWRDRASAGCANLPGACVGLRLCQSAARSRCRCP